MDRIRRNIYFTGFNIGKYYCLFKHVLYILMLSVKSWMRTCFIYWIPKILDTVFYGIFVSLSSLLPYLFRTCMYKTEMCVHTAFSDWEKPRMNVTESHEGEKSQHLITRVAIHAIFRRKKSLFCHGAKWEGGCVWSGWLRASKMEMWAIFQFNSMEAH